MVRRPGQGRGDGLEPAPRSGRDFVQPIIGPVIGPVIGIDFGTTNSVVTALRPDGTAVTLRQDTEAAFRSLLCFWSDPEGGALRHAAGPAAIEAYLEDPLASRLIMSMKSHLAQRSFTETLIFGRRWRLEALIGLFLRELLAPFGAALAEAHVVVGRPVHFVGERAEDAFGEDRLRAAFADAGLPAVTMALEPAAAGQRFAAGLHSPATVLVGDFGGGTSDFSLLRFDPGRGSGRDSGLARRVTALGHAGVGLAGDAFDTRIIDRVVSPLLGKGSDYRVMGKPLPVPPAWYASFAHWHRLPLMRAPKTLRDIAEVARTADHPGRLRHLVRLIEDEAGYSLYQAVSAAKLALSGATETVLSFRHEDFVVEAPITRAAFESWIALDLARMEAAVEAALTDAGIGPGAVDQVFLTGGTSLVPAVRAIFARRFGEERVFGGGEFVSVAEGLALMGREDA